MGKFIPNPAGIAAVGASPEMVEFLGFEAEKIEVAARDNAPVLTGDYLASIQSGSGIEDGQAVGRIWSDDEAAGYIEFGTGEPGPTPAFQPLRKAAESHRIE